jgi:hypothetical protein
MNKHKLLYIGKNCSKYFRNLCAAAGNNGVISLSSEMYDWVRNTFVEFSPKFRNFTQTARTTAD